MRHIDLFSGIGGFALAAKWTWGDEYVNFGHSEIEAYPCKVYHRHFPESECLGDITKIKWGRVIANAASRKTDSAKPRGLHAQSRGKSADARRIDLLTGGVPCQPASVAGKRRGTEDDRWLWPEALRAVRELKPGWLIFENPNGILSLQGGVPFDEVLSALEDEGYQNNGKGQIEPFIIPACAVNAPHRRNRVWIVAYRQETKLERSRRTRRRRQGFADGDRDAQHAGISSEDALTTQDDGQRSLSIGKPDCDSPASQDSIDSGNRRRDDGDTGGSERTLQTAGSDSGADPNPEVPGLEGRDPARPGRSEGRNTKHPLSDRGKDQGESWNESWYEVATRLCRVDDGLPTVLDRTARLKALGNSIVPQVAQVIFEAIKRTMEQ